MQLSARQSGAERNDREGGPAAHGACPLGCAGFDRSNSVEKLAAVGEPTVAGQIRAALASLEASSIRLISPSPWKGLTPGLNLFPFPREREALIYRPPGTYVLLFGGGSRNESLPDTWKFAAGSMLSVRDLPEWFCANR